jgi:hypothetical protein
MSGRAATSTRKEVGVFVTTTLDGEEDDRRDSICDTHAANVHPYSPRDQGKTNARALALGRPSIRPTPFAYSRLGRGIERCRFFSYLPLSPLCVPLWRSLQVFQGSPDSLFVGGAADEGDRYNERSATGGRRRSPLKRWGGHGRPRAGAL